MTYAVSTYYTPNYQSLADVTLPTMRAYCARHGYSFECVKSDVHSGWLKPQIVLGLLNYGFDAVLWIDSDALITNPKTTILDLLGRDQFVCTADIFGLSTGVFAVRSQGAGHRLMYAVEAVGRSLVRDHQWAEQEAIMRFAANEPYRDVVKVLPQRWMNSYWNSAYERPETDDFGQWKPGDFILHLPGMDLEQRIEIATRALELSK